MIIKTLASFCQKTQHFYNMREEIINLHASLTTKIKKIQMEVDKSSGQCLREEQKSCQGHQDSSLHC